MAQDETRVKWRASQRNSSSGTQKRHVVTHDRREIQGRWIGDKGNPRSHLELDKWQVREHLTWLLSSPNWLGERVKEREKGKTNLRGRVRERGSTFSLHFPTIGPSVSGKARGKVFPRDKSYK